MEQVRLKKFLVILTLLAICGFSVNCAYGFDREKLQIISEIGTLSNSQKYLQALDKCKTAMAKYPDEAELYYWSAVIKTHMKDNKSALMDFNKAVELNPHDSNVYVMRGITKNELGDDAGALADFDMAIKLDPKNSSAYSMRACVKIGSGDLQSANDDLEAANKLFDDTQKEEK